MPSQHSLHVQIMQTNVQPDSKQMKLICIKLHKFEHFTVTVTFHEGKNSNQFKLVYIISLKISLSENIRLFLLHIFQLTCRDEITK